jgi:hypothetical protein
VRKLNSFALPRLQVKELSKAGCQALFKYAFIIQKMPPPLPHLGLTFPRMSSVVRFSLLHALSDAPISWTVRVGFNGEVTLSSSNNHTLKPKPWASASATQAQETANAAYLLNEFLQEPQATEADKTLVRGIFQNLGLDKAKEWLEEQSIDPKFRVRSARASDPAKTTAIPAPKRLSRRQANPRRVSSLGGEATMDSSDLDKIFCTIQVASSQNGDIQRITMENIPGDTQIKRDMYDKNRQLTIPRSIRVRAAVALLSGDVVHESPDKWKRWRASSDQVRAYCKLILGNLSLGEALKSQTYTNSTLPEEKKIAKEKLEQFFHSIKGEKRNLKGHAAPAHSNRCDTLKRFRDVYEESERRDAAEKRQRFRSHSWHEENTDFDLDSLVNLDREPNSQARQQVSRSPTLLAADLRALGSGDTTAEIPGPCKHCGTEEEANS